MDDGAIDVSLLRKSNDGSIIVCSHSEYRNWHRARPVAVWDRWELSQRGYCNIGVSLSAGYRSIVLVRGEDHSGAEPVQYQGCEEYCCLTEYQNWRRARLHNGLDIQGAGLVMKSIIVSLSIEIGAGRGFVTRLTFRDRATVQ